MFDCSTVSQSEQLPRDSVSSFDQTLHLFAFASENLPAVGSLAAGEGCPFLLCYCLVPVSPPSRQQ